MERGWARHALRVIALFESGESDPLSLQIERAAPSVLEGRLAPSGFDQEGHCVVATFDDFSAMFH